MRKFADKQTKNNQTVQRLRPLYPLWILEGVGQYIQLPILPTNQSTLLPNIAINTTEYHKRGEFIQ